MYSYKIIANLNAAKTTVAYLYINTNLIYLKEKYHLPRDLQLYRTNTDCDHSDENISLPKTQLEFFREPSKRTILQRDRNTTYCT